jgi:hypothetical protein
MLKARFAIVKWNFLFRWPSSALSNASNSTRTVCQQMPCSQAPSQDEDLLKLGNKADNLRNAAVRVCVPTRILITIQSALLREAQFESSSCRIEAVMTFFQNPFARNLRSDATSDGLLELHREDCREPL